MERVRKKIGTRPSIPTYGQQPSARQEDPTLTSHRSRTMTATGGRLTQLSLIAALLAAAAAALLAIAPVAHAEATRALPDVREFHDGDAWNAFNAHDTRRAGMPTYDT